jgi:hypothetical protein
MRHERRRVSYPAVDALRAQFSGAPPSRRRSLYCIIEDTAEVDMDDPFRRIVPGEDAQSPGPPRAMPIELAATPKKRSLTAVPPAPAFRQATHIVASSPSLPRVLEDITEVNVGDAFGYGEGIQRPKPPRVPPIARAATTQKHNFTLRPPPRNPRRRTHNVPPPLSTQTRTASTVRFQTDESSVSRPLRPEPSTASGRRPRSYIPSATSSPNTHSSIATSTTASAYPSSYAEDRVRPPINILPPSYPPSLSSIYSEDLATPTTPRTRGSVDSELGRSSRDPALRSVWQWSKTAASPSTATSFPEHPFARNPPVSPSKSSSTSVGVSLASPSTTNRFPWPPPSIEEDKPRPASWHEQTDRPPRILPRTFFKAGFRAYIFFIIC